VAGARSEHLAELKVEEESTPTDDAGFVDESVWRPPGEQQRALNDEDPHLTPPATTTTTTNENVGAKRGSFVEPGFFEPDSALFDSIPEEVDNVRQLPSGFAPPGYGDHNRDDDDHNRHDDDHNHRDDDHNNTSKITNIEEAIAAAFGRDEYG
jgi:hypothetical protein